MPQPYQDAQDPHPRRAPEPFRPQPCGARRGGPCNAGGVQGGSWCSGPGHACRCELGPARDPHRDPHPPTGQVHPHRLSHPNQVPHPSPWSDPVRGSLHRRSPPAGREAGRHREYERLLAQAGLLRRGEATAQEEEEADRPLHDRGAHELRAPDAHRLWRHGRGRRPAHERCRPGDEVQGRPGATVEQLPRLVAYSWLFQPKLELPDPPTGGGADLECFNPAAISAEPSSPGSRWLLAVSPRQIPASRGHRVGDNGPRLAHDQDLSHRDAAALPEPPGTAQMCQILPVFPHFHAGIPRGPPVPRFPCGIPARPVPLLRLLRCPPGKAQKSKTGTKPQRFNAKPGLNRDASASHQQQLSAETTTEPTVLPAGVSTPGKPPPFFFFRIYIVF